MRSVFYRGTGRFTAQGHRANAKNLEIERGGEICIPEFLSPHQVGGRSIFKLGERNNGIDARLNAVGDTADVATGYQIVTDTLTYIKQQVSDQKFYKVAPASFMPVIVGDGSMASNILFNRTYSLAEDFEAGNIRTGTGDARLSSADVAIDGVTSPVQNWAKGINYTIFDVEQALRANNWDPIMGKHEARKTNWDLGIQITAFLGLQTDTRFPGLLTNANVNTNTAIITKYISAMTAAELATFLGLFIQAYFTNTNSTAMPNRMIVPYLDYMGMCQNLTPGTVGTYPVPLIDYLLAAFKKAVAPMEMDFQILPLSYADKTVNNSLRGLNKNYYALYRSDPKSVQMNIPTDYTTTQANSLNNFDFQDVSYGQYTGVTMLRNLEMLLFTF